MGEGRKEAFLPSLIALIATEEKKKEIRKDVLLRRLQLEKKNIILANWGEKW